MDYLNVEEVESALEVAASPPNHLFTRLIELPNLTWEYRVCHAIKLASGIGRGRTGVYFIGGVHAREWGSSDILIYFVERVAQAYRTNTGLTLGGKNFTAAQIQNIVNRLDIFVFPLVNPDGRNYSRTVDACWRKNRRPDLGAGPGCTGVDINRNFDFLWNYPIYFDPMAPIHNSTTTCGECGDFGYELYIGPSAASEPETRNVVWMVDTYPNIRYFVDVHSYSELILYPWGDDDNQTTDPDMNFQNAEYNDARGIVGDFPGGDAYKEYISTGDLNTVVGLANCMRDAIQAVRGRTYTVQQAADLYPTAGTARDYMFSRYFVGKSKRKIYSFVIEWGPEEFRFQPPYSEMQNIIQEVTAGLVEFCVKVMEATMGRISHVADFKVLRDRSFELSRGGHETVGPFTLPTDSALRGENAILGFLADPSGNAEDLEYEVWVNEDHMIHSGFFSGGVSRTLWEPLAADILQIGIEANSVEFRVMSGSGSVKFSRVVLWFQRKVAEAPPEE